MTIDINRLATLAKIHVTDEEKTTLERQLLSILDYVGKLQEVDTSNIDAKASLIDSVNVLREDVVTSMRDERDAVVAAFPKSVGDALEVPGVFVE
ncbi:MAG: Asp-tRNA(Asn)/Glu-tRNA(Gln) amidotransferase subunit GatC [Patescibacteria group bacterium]|jgi:aspartyl/glutamyl-tRNA(Asn/Gln) amidotransferase C subunit